MAATVLAEYANLAGATITLSRKPVLFGLLGSVFNADCAGCRDGVFATDSDYPEHFGDPEGRARGWAEKHAGQCRRRS